MIRLSHLKEGARIFFKSIKRKKNGIKRYSGNAEQICKQIIDDCWNKEKGYFQTSNGHFCEFWSRDFGWCCESLIKLGYEKECEKTLDFALDVFSEQGGIKTTITPSGKAIDVYYYSPDSLGYILRSLSLLKNKKIIRKYKEFLNEEIKRFHKTVIDKDGLVKSNKQFSSMKDYSKRKSSCYDNIFAWVVYDSLKKIKILDNPFCDNRKIVKDKLWNSKYFYDDLTKQNYIAADANIFAFWTGMFRDMSMIKKAVKSMQDCDLENPMPISYTAPKVKTKKLVQEIVVSGYEQEAIWTHMGPLFIDIVSKFDKKTAKSYLLRYKKTIEKHQNYLEIFDRNMNPYQTFFYHSDESMLWAANYLALSKKIFK